MTKQRGWTVGALVAVIVGVVAALGVSSGWFGSGSPGIDSSKSGVIVRYDGRDYWVSDYEVADAVLGETLATDLLFQDTTADVKAIEGQDPAVTVAAYLPPLSSASPTAGWRLVSTDPGYWTDQENVRANAALFVTAP
ncbi:hypothetical protein [Longivirga aurantiaca]|uniref:Uncharacterized protein n=1 Tax=Longivirga aurantiaca TaxID=1837743 RepID=A0ABW1SYJ1_9ACTN